MKPTNQKETTHTPTPFSDGGIDEGYGQINDAKGNKVARIYGSLNEVMERTNLIVRAVNSHEALLEAVKDALCELDPDCKYDGSNYNGEPSEKGNSRIQTILSLYKIIEQAEGK